jgi:hypothetical protein
VQDGDKPTPTGASAWALGDTDGDGVRDVVDIDGDGDGIPNSYEYVPSREPYGDHDGDGIPDYLDADDRGDGQAGCHEAVSQAGICQPLSPSWDTDGDGIANHLDTDADGDGTSDAAEAGVPACTGSVGKNGLCDALETSPDSNVWPRFAFDFDNDGWPEFLDPSQSEAPQLHPNRPWPPGMGTSEKRSAGDLLGVAFENTKGPAEKIYGFGFVEATKEAGLEVPHGGGAQTKFEEALRESAGVNVVDVDGDGDFDIYFPRPNKWIPPERNSGGPGPIGTGEDETGGAPGQDGDSDQLTSLWFINDGAGKFTRQSHDSGVTAATGALVFDHAGNGEFDVLLGSAKPAESQLFLQENGVLTRHEIDIITPAFSFAAADYDADGSLDLAIAHGRVENPSVPRFLLKNLARGVFEDVSPLPFLTSQTPLWADIDTDFWPDLAMTSDGGETALLLNMGDRFRQVPVRTVQNAYGQVFGDIDNDGDLDWFVSGIGIDARENIPPALLASGDFSFEGNLLLRNEGGGRFTDVTKAAGLENSWSARGACMADFDMDGYLDIAVTNGIRKTGVYADDEAQVWLNRGKKGFELYPLKNEKGVGRGIVCADMDGDGDPDIVFGNWLSGLSFWRSNAAERREANRAAGLADDIGRGLTVRLAMAGPNKQAVGAKIIVKSASYTQFREVTAGSSYQSQAPFAQHFGLGKDGDIQITVIWPDLRRTFTFVAARHDPRKNVREGQDIGRRSAG